MNDAVEEPQTTIDICGCGCGEEWLVRVPAKLPRAYAVRVGPRLRRWIALVLIRGRLLRSAS